MNEKTLPRIVTCPTCGRRARWDATNPWRPFCSERCRLIDLGEWLGEGHRIPGEAAPQTTPFED
ncbi:MAG: DNA gyrase inhibitor YacG [Gammaproteobacteria bacterium]|nr:MAG: DNA gyrase inhibitor YacG [Gammaproteobacteria bacterium]